MLKRSVQAMPGRRPKSAKRKGALCSAAGLASLLASVALAPPASAGEVFHLSFNGEVAIANWTTCPEPKAGDSCEDTTVIASDARTYETSDQPDGGHFLHGAGDRVVLQRFWYEVREVDGELTGVITQESFGGTNVGVDVRIHNRLTAASATAAAIPMHTTDYAGDREFDETVSVGTTWQPTGELTRIREGGRNATRDFMFKSTTSGWSREARATGVIDGRAIQGVNVPGGTLMYSARQADLSLYKGRPTP